MLEAARGASPVRKTVTHLSIALMLSTVLTPVSTIVTGGGNAHAAAVCLAEGVIVNDSNVDQFFDQIGNTRAYVLQGDPFIGAQGDTSGTRAESVADIIAQFDRSDTVVFSANQDLTMSGTADLGAEGATSNVGGGVGAPIVNTVEVTNSEVEELIRQRRRLSQETQVASAEPAPQPAEAAPAAPTSPAAKKSVTKASKTKAKKSAPVLSAAPPAPSVEPVPPPITLEQEQTVGVWSQAFIDYEKKSDLAPGTDSNTTRRQRTVGTMSGGDVTYHRYSSAGVETIRLGVLGGYIDTKSRFSDTVNVTNARQYQDGGFIGAYAAYQRKQWSFDFLAKADILNLESRSRQRRTETISPPDCQPGEVLVVDDPAEAVDQTNTVVRDVNEDVDQYTYTVGGNAYYRFDLRDGAWFEPVLGMRYSYTDYGSGAADLNVTNGESLRLQGGARIGRSWSDGRDRRWSVALLGLLYSDVVVNGYTLDGSGFTSTASEIDEGKLRVMGQLAGNVDLGDGWSFNGQVDVRGGEDLIGVGGRLGTRYEW